MVAGDPFLFAGFQMNANYWSLFPPQVFIPTVWTDEKAKKPLEDVQLTDKERRLKDMKEKLANLSAQERIYELMRATNNARATRDLEKHRVERRRKNKAASKSRAKNR